MLWVLQVQTYAWTVLDGSASVATKQVRHSQKHVNGIAYVYYVLYTTFQCIGTLLGVTLNYVSMQ